MGIKTNITIACCAGVAVYYCGAKKGLTVGFELGRDEERKYWAEKVALAVVTGEEVEIPTAGSYTVALSARKVELPWYRQHRS
jgi:hypothetical protein